GVRVVVLGPFGEQLGDVVGGVQGGQGGAEGGEALGHLGLGQEVQAAGGFAQEDDVANSQEVEGDLEVGLEPPAAFGQDAQLAVFTAPERGDAAGLGKIPSAANNSRRNLFHGNALAESPYKPLLMLIPEKGHGWGKRDTRNGTRLRLGFSKGQPQYRT